MLQSLNHLTLAVSNLQTSLTFWRDLLGLQLHAECKRRLSTVWSRIQDPVT